MSDTRKHGRHELRRLRLPLDAVGIAIACSIDDDVRRVRACITPMAHSLPAKIWWLIADAVDYYSDILSLSETNSSIRRLLRHRSGDWPSMWDEAVAHIRDGRPTAMKRAVYCNRWDIVADNERWTTHDAKLILEFAALENRVDIVEQLCISRFKPVKCIRLIPVAYRGHLDVLRLLNTHYPTDGEWSHEVADYTAGGGHLHLLQWLLSNRGEGCSVCALLLAAKDGHLGVIRWLYDNCCERVSKPLGLPGYSWLFRDWVTRHRSDGRYRLDADMAPDIAAENGHLDVLLWLHQRQVGADNDASKSTLTSYAMDKAAGKGHLHVLKWLQSNEATLFGPERPICTKDAMDGAAEHGHLHVVQWLVRHRTEWSTARVIGHAAINGHLDIIQWIHEHHGDDETKRNGYATYVACVNGHIETVKWLHEHRPEWDQIRAHNRQVFKTVARNGHLELAQWLYATLDLSVHKMPWRALRLAVEGGHIEFVQWLLTLPVKWKIDDAIETAEEEFDELIPILSDHRSRLIAEAGSANGDSSESDSDYTDSELFG